MASTIAPVAIWISGMFGDALMSFALLNWFSRHTLMGGIYGRPLLIANLMLTTNVTFSSLRMWRSFHAPTFAVTAVIGGVFLVAFGRLLFRTPVTITAPPSE